MNTNNNRSFFCDFIIDGWTKKDWALNLIPLGGIASVAYEIGSACFSSRDRTAKISEEFFKSPIQTTLKKIAQCLWVPIVVCGALKLVCFIVETCWNRCFPPANNRSREKSLVIDPRAKDPCATIPSMVVKLIFSYLNLHELGVSRCVSKIWNKLASTPILWREVIYREFAFSSKNWAGCDTDLVKDVSIEQEMLSLPDDIFEQLRCSAFPGKNIRQTHVLVRMPKGLTINKLGELAKKYFPKNTEGYRHIPSGVVCELGDEAVGQSVWLLMTKDILSESRGCKERGTIKTFVDQFAKTMGVLYKIPTILEAATCILAEYFRSRNCLFSGNPPVYTFCIENDRAHDMFVGNFSDVGLDIHSRLCKEDVDVSGVVALLKF